MYCEELLKEERRAVVMGEKGTARRELNDLLNQLNHKDTGADNIPDMMKNTRTPADNIHAPANDTPVNIRAGYMALLKAITE